MQAQVKDLVQSIKKRIIFILNSFFSTMASQVLSDNEQKNEGKGRKSEASEIFILLESIDRLSKTYIQPNR